MIQGLLGDSGIPSLLRPTGVDGTAVGVGLLPPGSRQVMVSESQADADRRLLAETLIEGEPDATVDSANARHLADASGRGPRGYGLIGAYARIWLWSLAAIGVAFGAFLLLHA